MEKELMQTPKSIHYHRLPVPAGERVPGGNGLSMFIKKNKTVMKTYELTYQLKLEANSSPLSVKSPADVVPYLREHCFPFKDMWREKAVVVFLDKANQITGYHVLSVGNAEQCCISPRDVVRAALIANAHSVILSHNHPSGNVRPGASDIEMTKKVKDALTVVGLTLLDHVIISPDSTDGVFSFAEDVVVKNN